MDPSRFCASLSARLGHFPSEHVTLLGSRLAFADEGSTFGRGDLHMGHQSAVQPPSTIIAVPVTSDAASDAR
jgi:hypothetical protein